MIRKLALALTLLASGCFIGGGTSSSSSSSAGSSSGTGTSGGGTTGGGSSTGGTTGSNACSIVGTWSGTVVGGPGAGTPSSTVLNADGTFHIVAGQVTLDGNYTYTAGQIDFLNTSGSGPTPGFSFCPGVHGTYTVTFGGTDGAPNCNTFTLSMVSDSCTPRVYEANGGSFHKG